MNADDYKPGPYPPNWYDLSKEVIKRRGNRCQRCGRSPPLVPWLTTHHIDGNPANNEDRNLYVSCPKCHLFIDRYVYPRVPQPLTGLQLPLGSMLRHESTYTL